MISFILALSSLHVIEEKLLSVVSHSLQSGILATIQLLLWNSY